MPREFDISILFNLFEIFIFSAFCPYLVGKHSDFLLFIDANKLFSTIDFPYYTILDQIIEEDGRVPALVGQIRCSLHPIFTTYILSKISCKYDSLTHFEI